MLYITKENQDSQREKIEKRSGELFKTITNGLLILLDKDKFMKKIKTFLKNELFNFSKEDETQKEIKINLFTEKFSGFVRSLGMKARAKRVWIADRPDVFFKIYHVCFQYKIRLDIRLKRKLDEMLINKSSRHSFHDNHEIIVNIDVLDNLVDQE